MISLRIMADSISPPRSARYSIICSTFILPFSMEDEAAPAFSIAFMLSIIAVISSASVLMRTGLPESISFCMSAIKFCTPVDTASTVATPIMPIEPAKQTSKVRLSLESRFRADSLNADQKESFAFFVLGFCVSAIAACASFSLVSFSFAGSFSSSVSPPNGLESATTSPSSNFMMRVEYFSASSGLCVTIITRRSFEISCIRSIICTEVTVSSAPVGSSASSISGSFTSARAIATRWHCPPDN